MPEADLLPTRQQPPMKSVEAASVPAATGEFVPVREKERILSLDVVRGYALLGVLIANMAFFSGHINDMTDMSYLQADTAIEQFCWATVRTIFEFKSITLFSLMFGVGLVIQMQRAQAAGKPFVPTYVRRLLLLMAFGVLDILLLWYGDILFIYGLCGFALLLVRNWSAKVLFWVGVGLLVFATLQGAAMLGLEQLAPPPEATETATTVEEVTASDGDDRWDRWGAALQSMRGGPESAEWQTMERIAFSEGPMAAAILTRLMSFMGMFIFAFILFGIGVRTIGLFLIGGALMKWGFFSPERRSWHVKCAIIGTAIGLPGEMLGTWLYMSNGYEGVMTSLSDLLHTVASLFMAMGLLGILCLLSNQRWFAWPAKWFAAVGRMALTNYVMQSVIITTLMYWYGFGWWGQTGWADNLKIAFIVFGCQIIFSVLWFMAFRMGPLEWIWRALTYLKAPPMLRRA